MDKNINNFLRVNDDIDLVSIIYVLLKNLNLLISIFLVSLFCSSIYYLSSTKIYQSVSTIEIQPQQSILPNNLGSLNSSITLQAQAEIYKSREAINDVVSKYKIKFPDETKLSYSAIASGLKVIPSSQTLLKIAFSYPDEVKTESVLNMLNAEFINDRIEFKKESSAAARKFISLELPKVRSLLSEAEDNLNTFKLSTNSTDIIFDDKTRNAKLNNLRDRIDEINFKELELKEFYKSNHPIYMTLSEQKKLVLNQIESIEKDIPEVPNRQRKMENLKREVDIYSDVIKSLTSEELNLSLVEASSISNVRIINSASSPQKISPTTLSIIIFPLAMLLIVFIIQAIRYFSNDVISNLDALSDFIGGDRIIGELPLLDKIDKSMTKKNYDDMANEMLQKTIYEITHSDKNFSSILFTSSRKDVGKTEISEKIFNLLAEEGKSVCLIDLDLRQGSLSKKTNNLDKKIESFEDFYRIQDKFKDKNSLFVPSFSIESIPNFLKSEEFELNINKLKEDYDYVLCDTPPWSLFVDSKIISKYFEKVIYIVGSDISTFKDIEIFKSEFHDQDSIHYFFNKFNYFYNFFGFYYQYPYYSSGNYYDYEGYRSLRKKVNIYTIFKRFIKNFNKSK
tara:strand:- start:2660 stop:4528 length:1869 start_codon:yes stop_codon:yes gene_type:complete